VEACRTCGQQTPAGNFCVRCGAPLARELEHARNRREFAAAPGESRLAPWLVSTLFPHLPRHSARHFRTAILAGTALVAALGILRLFGVALITAALLMPLATVLYFYDVDIYEAAPVRATALTVLWGAVTGTATGALAKALAPTGAALIDKGSSAHLLSGGILIPALGVVLMLAGPLLLLRDRTLDDALDGAGFGAACAATFTAAEAVVVGAGVLGGGLRPQGAALPWVERLLAIAVATPVLSMAAIGSAGAAIWLRYRAPTGDRRALGTLGNPAVAVSLAAALIVAAAAAETSMAAGVWLATLVVLDAVGLILLRRALHVGLLEESAELELGEPIRCANCGATTAAHTFCGSCGVALRALPKRKGATRAEAAAARGTFAGRIGAHHTGPRIALRWLIAWVTALAAAVGIGFAVGAVAAPAARTPACRPGVPCAEQSTVAGAEFAFPGYTLWQSSAYGYSLRYSDDDWSVGNQGSAGIELQAADGFSVLLVQSRPSSRTTPSAAISGELATLKGQLLGLTADARRSDQLLGTNVGLIPGPGSVYTATIASPQGPQDPVSIAIVAASSGGLTVWTTVITPGNNTQDQQAVFERADDVINSIRFPA
jgi:ribosomal protein L32